MLMIMSLKKLGMLIIRNNKNLTIGIVTDGDLKRALQKNKDIQNITVKNIMTKNPKIILDDTPLLDALSIMTKNKITCLFISKTKSSKKPVGIIHIHDCLRLIQN